MDTVDETTTTATTTEFWRSRYQRQQLVIASLTSLLNRYGDSVDLESLHSAFLLTLMGHYVVGDACYYMVERGGSQFVPSLAYGRIPLDSLPPIAVDSALHESLARDTSPRKIEQTEHTVDGELSMLTEAFHVVAPLYMQTRLVGIVFLGRKVTGEPFRDFDMEVLYALCGVSAATFNNAILYRNARLAADEIQKLYSVRSEIMNRITHEFRTPLTAVRAGVDLLVKLSDGDSSIHTIVLDSLQRLEGLISSLLTLNQNEHGGDSSEEHGTSDPIKAVQEATFAQDELARAHGVRMTFHRDSQLEGMRVAVGRENLMAAIRAIVDNAIKFSRPNGTVTIFVERSYGGPAPEDGECFPDWRLRTQELIAEMNAASGEDALQASGRPATATLPRRSGYLVVRISDEGIGIPAEDIMAIAEPFRQAGNSPLLGVRGRGLGLSLAQKSISDANGHLYCRSSVGEGSVFSIFLPVL